MLQLSRISKNKRRYSIEKNKSFEKNVYKENKAIKYSLIFVSIISISEFIGLIYLIRKKSIL